MKKMYKLTVLAFTALALFVGCDDSTSTGSNGGTPSESDLIGTWEVVDAPTEQSYTFEEGGDLVINPGNISGSWSIDGDELTYEFSGLSQTYEVSLKGDELAFIEYDTEFMFWKKGEGSSSSSGGNGNSPFANDIIGSWYAIELISGIEVTTILTFEKDGDLKMDYKLDGESETGFIYSWSINGNEITITIAGESYTDEIDIIGDELVFYEDGEAYAAYTSGSLYISTNGYEDYTESPEDDEGYTPPSGPEDDEGYTPPSGPEDDEGYTPPSGSEDDEGYTPPSGPDDDEPAEPSDTDDLEAYYWDSDSYASFIEFDENYNLIQTPASDGDMYRYMYYSGTTARTTEDFKLAFYNDSENVGDFEEISITYSSSVDLEVTINDFFNGLWSYRSTVTLPAAEEFKTVTLKYSDFTLYYTDSKNNSMESSDEISLSLSEDSAPSSGSEDVYIGVSDIIVYR
jgi:hypothetical protein